MTTKTTTTRRIISDTKARLRDAFLEAFEHTPTPCKDSPDTWTADNRGTRNYAASRCLKCKLVDACDAWASADPPETDGVWGGRDRAAGKTKSRPQRVCRGCGKPFKPASGGQKYHPACGAVARAQRHRKHDAKRAEERKRT